MKRDNRKVQIRLAPYSGEYKCVDYRIDPSELNWIQRLFNVWMPVEWYIFPEVDDPNMDLDIFWKKYIVKIGAIDEVKEQFKTMDDINQFHNEQFRKYDRAYEKLDKISKYDY